MFFTYSAAASGGINGSCTLRRDPFNSVYGNGLTGPSSLVSTSCLRISSSGDRNLVYALSEYLVACIWMTFWGNLHIHPTHHLAAVG